VILTDSQDAFEAFAFMPRMDGPRRGMLIMTEGLLNLNGIDKETQLGIVAHEMAHILFWHQDVDGRSLRPILRAGQPVNSETETAFSRWMFLGAVAGGHSHSALNGLQVLLTELESSTSQIMDNYSYYLWGFDLTKAGAVENLRTRSGALIRSSFSCLELRIKIMLSKHNSFRKHTKVNTRSRLSTFWSSDRQSGVKSIEIV